MVYELPLSLKFRLKSHLSWCFSCTECCASSLSVQVIHLHKLLSKVIICLDFIILSLQDDVCVGGLVVVLSNDDVSIVETALEVSLTLIHVVMNNQNYCLGA